MLRESLRLTLVKTAPTAIPLDTRANWCTLPRISNRAIVTTQNAEAHYVAQQRQNLARRTRRRSGLGPVEFHGRQVHHHRRPLRRRPSERAVLENAALSFLRGPVDHNAVRAGDRAGTSVCLVPPDPGTRSWLCPE